MQQQQEDSLAHFKLPPLDVLASAATTSNQLPPITSNPQSGSLPSLSQLVASTTSADIDTQNSYSSSNTASTTSPTSPIVNTVKIPLHPPPPPVVHSSSASIVNGYNSGNHHHHQNHHHPTTNSSSSIDDVDVRLAAAALGQISNSATAATSPTGLMPEGAAYGGEFFNRVQSYPMVSSALRHYNDTKSKSRLLNYGAGVVESVARPLVTHLEPLDEFACRQLDRIERGSNTTWHNLVISTSGLATSISDESIRNLRYILGALKHANTRIGDAIKSLQELLATRSSCNMATFNGKVVTIKREILSTIKWIIGYISQYTATTLPEQARHSVRAYLFTLTDRWVIAASARDEKEENGGQQRMMMEEEEEGDGPATHGVHRLIGVATETLDVLFSVYEIVNGTLQSAEEWCDTWARRASTGSSANANQLLQYPPPPPTTTTTTDDTRIKSPGTATSI